jgi:hypothetical protein
MNFNHSHSERFTMKTSLRFLAVVALASSFILLPSTFLEAATTINSVNKYAYGANTGWQDWRGDTNNGVVIGDFVCSGFIYDANTGWIHLGDGTPTNGIQYLNVSSNDFGVNHDGLGNLRGFAYGANIGWVNFENNGAAKVDLVTGRLSGSIYSANCGWISLSNAFAFVQTDTIPSTDTDGDGISDQWEQQKFGNLTTADASTDADGDGQTDKQEYLADTNPLDAGDHLQITAIAGSSAGTTNGLTWTSKPTRHYRVLQTTNLALAYATNITLGLVPPDVGATTTRSVTNTATNDRYFKVQSLRPLAP